MPYIRVDLDVRSDRRWLLAPPPLRAKAKALYLDALSYSGELLTNGHVSHSVMLGIAHELGVERPQKVMRFLVDSGHASVTEAGFFLNDWERFHDSRATVHKRRSDAAKRKQRSRAQTRLPLSRAESQRDGMDESQRDTAVTRPRASAHAKQHLEEDQPRAVELDMDDDGEPDLGVPNANGTGPGHREPDERTAPELQRIEELTPDFEDIPL